MRPARAIGPSRMRRSTERILCAPAGEEIGEVSPHLPHLEIGEVSPHLYPHL